MKEQNTAIERGSHRDRDALSMKILGAFFILLSLLVFLGSLWELGNYRALVVTFLCGSCLLIVGIGMVTIGRKMANTIQPFPPPAKDHTPSG